MVNFGVAPVGSVGPEALVVQAVVVTHLEGKGNTTAGAQTVWAVWVRLHLRLQSNKVPYSRFQLSWAAEMGPQLQQAWKAKHQAKEDYP